MGAVFKGAVADEFTIEAAFIGEVYLFRHQSVETGADVAALLVQVEGQFGWLLSLEVGEEAGDGGGEE